MSAAAPADAAAPAPKGKKKLIIIVAALVLVLGGGGAAAMVIMKKKAAEAEAAAAADEDGGETKAHAPKKKVAKDEHKTPPVFMPLEPFVVNLADKDADRFAQVGITLEVEDAKASEELKAYMPAIRNGVLMVLSHKTSKELMEVSGKQLLAASIKREAVRPLGFDLPDPEKAKADEASDDDEDQAPKKKKKKKKAAEAEEDTPVKNVLFSSFIIQ
jgi:flagellar protein FliL